jgi:ABC transporter substrate binding protein
MSYSTDVADMFRRAASYVDRVLKGENPADLPVQAPTKFETMLNLRTAKALGFAVPIRAGGCATSAGAKAARSRSSIAGARDAASASPRSSRSSFVSRLTSSSREAAPFLC